MTLFMRAALGLLQRMKNPALLPVGMQYVERFLPPGEEGLDLLLACAVDPAWVTRYLAAKNLGAHYPEASNRVWETLLRLTHDPERFVREGVPLSLAAIAVSGPSEATEEKMLALAASEDAHVRRAAAYTALVLWRQEQCPALRVAMLTRVAGKRDDGIGRLLGRRIVAEEVARIDGDGAMKLAAAWAESADPHLHWQAEQALQGTLATAFPERVASLRKRLMPDEEKPQAAVSASGPTLKEQA